MEQPKGTLPRDLTFEERALLEHLLSAPFPGVDALRAQAQMVKVASNCSCGCATVGLRVDKAAPIGKVVSDYPVEAIGDELQVCLEVRDGLLSELEIIEFFEEKALSVPSPTKVPRLFVWTADDRLVPAQVSNA